MGVRKSNPQDVTANICYSNHKWNAVRRSYNPLPKSHWLSLVSKPCVYCGTTDKKNATEIGSAYKARGVYDKTYDRLINGVDRVNNALGYTLENSVPCCAVCNDMKGSLSKDEFLTHLIEVNKCHPR